MGFVCGVLCEGVFYSMVLELYNYDICKCMVDGLMVCYYVDVN